MCRDVARRRTLPRDIYNAEEQLGNLAKNGQSVDGTRIEGLEGTSTGFREF
jgi:hypothetical protein